MTRRLSIYLSPSISTSIHLSIKSLVYLAICTSTYVSVVSWLFGRPSAICQHAHSSTMPDRCNNAHGEREIGTKRPPPEVGPAMKRRKEGESVIAGKD
eukprot:3873598-Amphidinium_carterae.1